ncbi:hypothetical protein SPRG_09588 [Saprolegnia parasitica CBS 223.65]|uniref:Uncharacterized protein n=1 Tax=Saprolegnia parasitica (strain CBS 223.65) TaxID=695850 RepID=A0A067C2C5_SAPPC|nr:hypothetical protein SPRG_09588 [Saprolegnia parasitica CBS 223.65]KDO24944.1 hypothetical protein SPRG_09588 [Saprolegnia parasitica CBS 223.65]|eukprot:XP_012204404.1 hypothetical protein SPRG_09588 [Saprolegnia parasitica CBS 223.65]
MVDMQASSKGSKKRKHDADAAPKRAATKAKKATAKPTLPVLLGTEPARSSDASTKKLQKGAPPEESTTCMLCNASLKLKDLRQHVGGHMALEDFSVVRCGFCGQDDGSCVISLTAGTSTVTVTPVPQGNCPRFRKFYVTSATKNHKCTNIPTQCARCNKWLWKYTLRQHYRDCHDGLEAMTDAEREATTLSQAELDGLHKLASDIAGRKRKAAPRPAPTSSTEPELSLSSSSSSSWIDAFVPLEVEPNVFLV